MPSGLLQPDYV